MVNGIGRVIKVKENSFVTDIGREYEFPFDLEGVTADSLNEWLDYFIEQLIERRAHK
ncbi:MAG: hypothetical protein FWE59_02600 [Oscillospiraceae bacterium]|nr:hypothetical protein [Oscillospiraceae bacterium]